MDKKIKKIKKIIIMIILQVYKDNSLLIWNKMPNKKNHKFKNNHKTLIS